MAASREDIVGWFIDGVGQNASHMIVVCDTFEWDDYPIFCRNSIECIEFYNKYKNGENMQRIMEVYDLRISMAEQLNERRCFNLPDNQPSTESHAK